jgi:hypothetical protein
MLHFKVGIQLRLGGARAQNGLLIRIHELDNALLTVGGHVSIFCCAKSEFARMYFYQTFFLI